MKEYRICETCEAYNDVAHLTCGECGAGLHHIMPEFVKEEQDKRPVKEAERVEETVKQEKAERVEENKAEMNDTSRATQLMERLYMIDSTSEAEIELPITEVIVGREGNFQPHLFTKSNFVSRKHAKITFTGFQYELADLGSHNGTYLNGDRLTPHEVYLIKHNDTVVFADLTFQFRFK